MGQTGGVRRARGRVVLASAFVLAMATGPGVGPAHAADALTVDVAIGSCEIAGKGPASVTGLLVAHRGSDGRLKRRARVDTDFVGRWRLTCVTDDEPVERGDRIRVAYDVADRTFSVPRLTMRIDRATDVVSGRASPSGTLEVSAYNCRFSCGIASVTRVFAAITPQGTFATDLTDGAAPDLDLLGLGRVSLRWTGGSGDTVSTNATVPYLQVIAGDHRVSGAAAPYAVVTVVLKTNAGVTRGTARTVAGPDGRFSAAFRKSNLDPVRARVGDRIASDHIAGFTMLIPAMSITGDTLTDEVSGACPAGRPLRVTGINDPPLSPDNITLFPTCSGGGTYLEDLGLNLDVSPGTRLQLRVQRPAGDYVGILGGVPDAL